MDAEQLWETTWTRSAGSLSEVEIEDARMATGDNQRCSWAPVGPPRQFIYEHADEAEIDA